MVTTNFIDKVTKSLEKFLIKKNGFKLSGLNYDLILFSPTDQHSPDTKFSIILSAQMFNQLQHKDIIKEILSYLNSILSQSEYDLISRINILHSEDPLVKNMRLIFSYREPIYEINNYPIGGVMIEFAYLVKSLVLDKLISGKAINMLIENDNYTVPINAGIIEIDHLFNIKYWTGKGLREFTEVKEKSEDFLLQNQYIQFVNLDKVLRIE